MAVNVQKMENVIYGNTEHVINRIKGNKQELNDY